MDQFQLLQLQADQVKAELDSMIDNDFITEALYNKSITSLAYEYALNGYSEDCILMLLNLKGDYFQSDSLIHMEEDSSFFNKCVFIFELLSFLGYIPFETLATQKEGKA